MKAKLILQGITMSCVLALLASGFLPSRAIAQAITTAQIVGRVIDQTGAPVSGASVSIRHEPTGSTTNTSSRNNGSFSARGLRAGGPYTVEAIASGMDPVTRTGVFLDLDRASEVTLTIGASSVVVLDAVEITASDYDLIFSSDRKGSGTNLDSRAITSQPVGDRSLNSLLRLDPKVIYNRNPSDQAISAGGISNRYNQISIDGVSASDPFGLTANNTAAARNVVPLDSVETVSIATSPFDVRQTGFTGAFVNAVTKSGTNEFKGSAYLYYRDNDWVAQNLEDPDGDLVPVPAFREQTIGATLGGPIVQDNVFFFVSYEQVREDRNPSSITNFPEDDALNRIIAQAKALGLEVGEETAPTNRLEDDNILAKLDWQINQDHRLTLRYNNVESTRPIFPNYGGRNFSFDSHWYSQDITNESYILQLFSNWTDRLTTEVSVSLNEYFSAPVFGRRSPQVVINNVPVEGSSQTGRVSFGTERSRHFNRLETETMTTEFFASYELNDSNTLTFGYQYDTTDVFNAFVQDFLGNYDFDSIEDFEKAGTPGWNGTYRYQYENPGQKAAAEFVESNHGFFAQNTWRPNGRLSVTGGLRFDMPVFDEEPPLNQLFLDTFGYRNNYTYDGNSVIQPRLGFNYKLDETGDKQVRGGIGLFYGRMPRVWMSNSYSNTGFNFISISESDANTPALVADPDNQPELAPGFGRQQVVALAEDFELPSRWKATLAYDHRFGDHVFSVEGEYTWVNKDVLFTNINRKLAYTTFEGRNVYSGRISDDFVEDSILTGNTDKGYSYNLSLSVERPMKDDGWSYSLSYTFGEVREVQFGTSSVARSNWRNRSVLNSGEDTLRRGELEVKHRFLAVLTKEIDWGTEGFDTTISLIYEGRSGYPFSFIYSSDVNGDGNRFNDLIFVPERGDPRVQFATAADQENFFKIVDRYNLRTGQVADSGAGRYPFVNQFDLSLKQQIKLPGWHHSLELGLDILNIGNLINRDWGLIRGSNSFFQKTATVANASYDSATGTYTYSNVSSDLATEQFTPLNSRGEPDASRWMALLSVRYKF